MTAKHYITSFIAIILSFTLQADEETQTEVNTGAKTGKIVSTQLETPKYQAKEAAIAEKEKADLGKGRK